MHVFLAAQSCTTLCDPKDCSPPISSVHEDSPGKNTGEGGHALLQGNLPSPGAEPKSPAIQVDSSQHEPPGKPIATEGNTKRATLQTWRVLASVISFP